MRRPLYARARVTLRAYVAVVAARLYRQRSVVLWCCAAGLICGIVAPPGLAPASGFCALVGILMALQQRPGRCLHLDRCEQGAPLFGRELARAKALVPCLATAVVALIYALAAFWRAANIPLDVAAGFATAVAPILIALCATVRRAALQAMYLILALAAAAAAYGLVVAHFFFIAVALCAIASFLALRQYGEALARFDPI